MKKIIFILLIGLCLFGCGEKEVTTIKPNIKWLKNNLDKRNIESLSYNPNNHILYIFKEGDITPSEYINLLEKQ